MRAVVITEFGGPDVLRMEDVPDPKPSSGELLVDVAAAGVNFMDVYGRIGRAPYRKDVPFVLGAEGAGTVLELGPTVSGFAKGDRVAWIEAPGSYADKVVVRANRAVHVPDAVSLELAAAAMIQGLTAQYLTVSTYAIQPGDVVAVHAAAGGTGRLIVQFAKHLGATVVATTSTPQKAEFARAAGADFVVDYDEFSDEVARVTSGVGVAVVYDGVGAATFESSLRALRRRGYLVLFGASSGLVPPFDLARLAQLGSLFVTRPLLGAYIADDDEFAWRAREVFTAAADGWLALEIGGTYPLGEAARAHADLEGRRTTGKLILTTD
ncbi:MAG: quinone oxidoreductase [Acidimicrobiales bacterium]